MDDRRFDRLARAFATRANRRATLAALLSAGLAGTTAAATSAKPKPANCLPVGKRCSEPAAAERHGHGRGGKGKQHAPSCAKCCSRFGAAGANGKARCTCKGEGVACANASQCCGGQCRNSTCTGCPGAMVFCSDGCADLQTNDQHCGSCAKACAAGQRCENGACVCDAKSCPTGCCDGSSCKRGTSPGACGNNGEPCHLCQSGETCPDGTCVCASAVICSGSGCCASADDVCDLNDQCCTPATCQAGQCGTTDDGCGGPLDCGDCPSGQICNNNGACQSAAGTCQAGQDACQQGVGVTCNNDFECFCGVLQSGAVFCFQGGAGCHLCDTDAECAAVTGPGSACIPTGAFCCTGSGFARSCAPPCKTATTTAARTRGGRRRPGHDLLAP